MNAVEYIEVSDFRDYQRSRYRVERRSATIWLVLEVWNGQAWKDAFYEGYSIVLPLSVAGPLAEAILRFAE